MPTEIRRYVRSLELDAYVVGGAVRDELLGLEHTDEDFLVPGVDHDGLRALLAPHGRVEDLEVHGQLVGVRLYAHDRAIRASAPKGIEFTPPRVERSTGPAHRDFEIVVDPSASIEADMARRDFTVNAMARRLADGALVDPFGGREALERRELRTVSATSFADDPLRILRGLRLVSQLGFHLAAETESQMRAQAAGLAHVSAERIGGGVAADGMGELSKLLLGREPAVALRLMRDTGALVVILPELEAAIGYRQASARQVAPLDEHLFAVVANVASAGEPLPVRLAALLHDAGKPEAERGGGDHAARGAVLAGAALRRLRYPTRLVATVRRIVAGHAFALEPWADRATAPLATRRFLAAHGGPIATALIAHKRADLAAKRVPEWEPRALEALSGELAIALTLPHRLADLAVDGNDLIAAGREPGPDLGRVLRELLRRVVDEPALNTRSQLLALAEEVAA